MIYSNIHFSEKKIEFEFIIWYSIVSLNVSKLIAYKNIKKKTDTNCNMY